MTTLKSHIDAKKQNTGTGSPAFETKPNGHEVRCGMCGQIGYVDEETFQFVSEAIKAGLDNPFKCEICEREYDELAYEG